MLVVAGMVLFFLSIPVIVFLELLGGVGFGGVGLEVEG